MTLVVCLVFALCAPGFASASNWPEVSEQERQLSALDDYPDADAVVLQKRGRLVIDDRGVSSYLEIFERVKVLNEAGVDLGTVSLFAGSFYRMRNLEGRTHTPDGRVVELTEEAKFEKSFDQYYSTEVLSFAMPEVQPGAIIEYRYQIFFDSWAFSDPWFFQGRLPVLYSEIVYEIPGALGFAHLPMVPAGLDITHTSQRGANFTIVTYVGKDLPPVPDEVRRFPYSDLAAQVTFLPRSRFFSGRTFPLFDDWESAQALVEGDSSYGYTGFKSDCGDAKRKARALRAEAGSSLAAAQAIFRFVRDEISTEFYFGVGVGEIDCDDLIKAGRGDFAEKSLLLHFMLDAAKIDSTLVWVRSRNSGRAQPNLPNPFQFEHLLVEADLEGRLYLLHPGDPDIAFGALSPWLEGVQALRLAKKPEWFEIPFSEPTASQQTSRVELKVGAEGGVAGKGSLELTGHAAWNHLDGRRSAQEVEAHWRGWLESSYPGFDVSEVKAEERLEKGAIIVRWSLQLREEEVLGEEALLGIAAPLRLESNPFSLPTELRLTPVQMAFALRDVSEVRVSWPSGWSPEGVPQPKSLNTPVGHVLYQVDGSMEERWLSVQREFSLKTPELIGREAYDHLRRLYATATASDSEEVVLVAGDAGAGE
ncbi:MAG: DUF3857 domain-containing protein [Acidobacteriota bacterium]